MVNATEAQERRYLRIVTDKIRSALTEMDHRVGRYSRDIQDQKTYLWEHRADMDHVEKISARESAEQTRRSGEVAADIRRRLEKLVQSPYFGRIDFRPSDLRTDPTTKPVYIGVHAFADEDTRDNLIYDWRAPISSMFYDFELGDAGYRSPSGQIHGEITLKRQFRIRGGEMVFMLESGLNILDDVLQEELSRTSDDRMKNIVSTIQRDQNAIIRNEDAGVLIIQGVAGSGKTSIALHRVAFLLYRFKDTLRSSDILILSPNRVFGHFIANVLPELGEEPIAELEMDRFAVELLERKIVFQTHFEQSAALAQGSNRTLQRRVESKSTTAFLERLDAYVQHLDDTRFRPTDLVVQDEVIPAGFLEQAYRKRPDLPLPGRLQWVWECVEQEAWTRWRVELTRAEKMTLRATIRKMGRNAAVRTLYREFFAWMGEPTLLKAAGKSVLEYSDVFPLIYLKLRLEGLDHPWGHIRHLVVDEMQDYTPVQYAVIARLFSCNKTILGDIHQSLNGTTSGSAEMIGQRFPYSECVFLRKSYRSSYEITRFSQHLLPSVDLEPIERHGTLPVVRSFESAPNEEQALRDAVTSFSSGSLRTLGILCRTPVQAEDLYNRICIDHPHIHLISAGSSRFEQGVVICCVQLAKGLEFDQVIVPDASAKNYHTPLDRQLLYVACTRAMHVLKLTHTGPLTAFVKDATLYRIQ